MPSDPWSAEAYNTSASFVPQLTSKLLTLLHATPGDQILDIGSGDGRLTSTLAHAVGPTGTVLGLDSSPSFIEHATSTYSSQKNLSFQLQDCSALHEEKPSPPPPSSSSSSSFSPSPALSFAAAHAGRFDKIFTNASLHWILHSPSQRLQTLRALHTLLKPGGIFVFEFGGAGNVSEVHTALIYALVARGIPVAEARATSPWFFPSKGQWIELLREAGFVVLQHEERDDDDDVVMEYRPTRLEERDGRGGGGLEGWVRLMGMKFLEKVAEGEEREGMVREVCEVLRDVCGREGGEGGTWLGYVRCRGVARRAE